LLTSIPHLHLTFSGLVCILPLWRRQEQCPFTARLRGLKPRCGEELLRIEALRNAKTLRGECCLVNPLDLERPNLASQVIVADTE
jgi:hypothetical protein